MRRDLLEDESNTERWMISYADFITLLFAFFVVMYAISSVNDEKYRVLSDTLAQAFDVDLASPEPIQIGEPLRAASPHVVDIPDTEGWADDQYGDTFQRDVGKEETPLGGFAAQEGVSVAVNNEWLEVNLGAELLFAPGQAELSAQARARLQPLVEIVSTNDNPVTIEGYTDNVPPAGGRYASNWELSGARASAIAQFLVEQGVRRHRIAAIGYGENHPVETNALPAGRAANRRVAVIVARRASLVRNRNAEAAGSGTEALVSHVRPAGEPAPAPRRKDDGGLIFSNDAALASETEDAAAQPAATPGSVPGPAASTTEGTQ